MVTNPQKKGVTHKSHGKNNDLVRLYLEDIGRVDILNSEEEVILARLIQERELLLDQKKELGNIHKAIKELNELEALQKQIANRLCHWPTKQELSLAT